MSSEVDICNLALARLGDEATVASIDPPEGSAQAAHCARFYPMARDSLLEIHAWNFTQGREALALLVNEAANSTWLYTYAVPSDMINVVGIYDPTATDDLIANGTYTPQPYVIESLESTGEDVIMTNQDDAVIRYARRVTDPTRFSPLFTDALAWLLASYLAGPILKGETGVAAAQSAHKAFMARLSDAIESDANQRRFPTTQSVSWITGRL